MFFRLAEQNMREELILLWRTCFEDTAAGVSCFFDHWFLPENCAVCMQDGRIASALYMLPTVLTENGAEVKAHYIYAAATLPPFRGKGYMSGLLAYVNEQVSPQKGQKYSVLLPAQESLYAYYRKEGYVNFFQTRFVTLDRNVLKEYAKKGFSLKSDLKPDAMHTIRSKMLAKMEGAVLWDDSAIAYACEVNRIYGGKMIYSKGGYALCREEQNVAEIMEMMVEEPDFYNLMSNLYNEIHANQYRFRLPVSSSCFAGQGETAPFGMIRPTKNHKLPVMWKDLPPPYLGLTLD